MDNRKAVVLTYCTCGHRMKKNQEFPETAELAAMNVRPQSPSNKLLSNKHQPESQASVFHPQASDLEVVNCM